MKKALLFCFLSAHVMPTWAFTWSAQEYVANCSIVHKEKFTIEDCEKIAHCTGIVKGALAGIATTRFLYGGDPDAISTCLPSMDVANRSMFDIRKDVNATIQLMTRDMDSKDIQQTAGAAVATALTTLYPCLME